jgi:YidC/Oxa1 family membrane protein insertase
MDKNTIIGLSLIGLILIGFSFYNAPSDEEIKAFNKRRDSIEAVEKLKKETVQKVAESKIAATQVIEGDSAKTIKAKASYGSFYSVANGENRITFLENDVMKLGVANKGGRVVFCELKKYKTYHKKALMLLDKDSSSFGLNFNFENKNI